jgi:hypothetical protein
MKDVVVGEVAVINAAAERIASIVLTVGPTPLPRSQPYPVTPRPQILHVKKVVFDEITLRRLVSHRPALPAVAVEIDSSAARLKKSVPDNRVGCRKVLGILEIPRSSYWYRPNEKTP